MQRFFKKVEIGHSVLMWHSSSFPFLCFCPIQRAFAWYDLLKNLFGENSWFFLSFHLYHTNIELYQGCQENFLDSVQRETIAAEGDWDRDRVWGIGRMS